MRLLAGLAIALGCGVATEVAAQSPPVSESAARLNAAAFAPNRAANDQGDFSKLADREQFRPDGAPVRWRSSSVKLGETTGGAVDSLRLSVGGALRTPSGLPVELDPRAAELNADAYEIAVTRDWKPVRFDAGAYDVRVTPHTGVGVSNAGGQAEAGATLTVGQKRDDMAKDRLQDLGVGDGSAYGDRGRWYFFAAASGRAVGLNVLRNDGGWDRDGWTTDASSALVGDAHVGVGWRKGAMQTSFGYIHREIKGEHRIFGEGSKEDSVVAFSLSIKPQQ